MENVEPQSGAQQPVSRAFIFECNEKTYLECIEKSLFGSNLPWPLQVKKGATCFLYHLDLMTLFGIWEATADGGRSIVARAWGGRFPFQVRVQQITAETFEIPKAVTWEFIQNPSTGRHDNILEGPRAVNLIRAVREFLRLPPA